MLKRITLTGADNSLDPCDLLPISKQYPFVEWGILVSGPSRGGSPRWPSMNWSEAVHGMNCPHGGCTGSPIVNQAMPHALTPEANGHWEVRRRAWRAGAAEELSELFWKQARHAFQNQQDAEANMKRECALFAAGWAKNEREVQSRLENVHGRYDV